MSYERVLIVNPPSEGEWRGIRPHIGLGYLAETLSANGIAHDVFDMNLGYDMRDLEDRIAAFKPDLIGMSLLTLEHRKFYDMLSHIKERCGDAALVVGGPHVTISKEEVLRDCAAIDFGILYEGEEVLVELCRGETEVSDIRGLVFRDDGQVVRNKDRGFVEDLDRLPWPRYESFELDKYVREAEIYSSRGCPHQCIFCPNRLISPVFRARSPEHVVDEMQYWYERGYRQFNFDDDNFNLLKDRVYAICDEIERRGLKDLFLRCSNGIRADRIDRDLLTRMREVGFHYIAFGADAGNDKMLKIVKKGETRADIERAVGAACELGYDVKLLFVVGTPQETWADVEDKVDLCEKYPIQDAHFYNIIPYPGTELFEWIRDNDLFLRDPEDYLNDTSCLENEPVFETPELPAAERRRVFKRLRRVQRRIHRSAVRRVLGDIPVVGTLLGFLLANKLVERVFYQNFAVRRLVEGLRYRRATARG